MKYQLFLPLIPFLSEVWAAPILESGSALKQREEGADGDASWLINSFQDYSAPTVSKREKGADDDASWLINSFQDYAAPTVSKREEEADGDASWLINSFQDYTSRVDQASKKRAEVEDGDASWVINQFEDYTNRADGTSKEKRAESDEAYKITVEFQDYESRADLEAAKVVERATPVVVNQGVSSVTVSLEWPSGTATAHALYVYPGPTGAPQPPTKKRAEASEDVTGAAPGTGGTGKVAYAYYVYPDEKTTETAVAAKRAVTQEAGNKVVSPVNDHAKPVVATLEKKRTT